MKYLTSLITHRLLLLYLSHNCLYPSALVWALDEPATQAELVTVAENSSSSSVLPVATKINTATIEPSIMDIEAQLTDKTKTNNEELDNSFSGVFADLAQNSGIANDVSTNAQAILTLTDPATTELQQRAEISTQPEEPSAEKSNITDDAIFPPEQIDTADNLTDVQHEDIPSFSEWAQKRLEEAEKKEQVNSSVQNGVKQGSGAKLRWKNYASLDCGAKVIAANPEAVSPWAILSPSRDEYKLNTCTSRIWFIVELCEAIQAKKIDLANYELFSSSPQQFSVSVSDRYPSREWSNVGHFVAKDEKDLQSFDLDPQIFGKYIKVEVKSHYGSEHYCPISLFRVYGTSVFEVLQKEDPAHVNREDDDDDDELDVENGDKQQNLFSSATDAVMSIVKKAAEVLGNKGNYTNRTSVEEGKLALNYCSTPSHLVVCDNCTDKLFGEVYELLSCRDVSRLSETPFVKRALMRSDSCKKFGFAFGETARSWVQSFFPERYLGAMCNSVAVMEGKVVLNVSLFGNLTQVDEVRLDPPFEVETVASSADEIAFEVESQATEELVFDDSVRASCSTDVEYTSQIRPTKTFVANEVVFTASEVESLDAVEFEVEEEEIAATTESVEVLEEHLENLIADLNEDSVQSVVSPTAATPAQKESVFLRLSNRIKTLERNMSLSSQYLEELSKRYKKQVEEMQRLLEKTIVALHEESKRKDDRNKQLEERLDQLTIAVENLIVEKSSWTSTIVWMFFSGFLATGVFTLCSQRARRSPDECEVAAPSVEIHRRKSIDVVTHCEPPKKKRRPSDQALKIVRSSLIASENAKKERKKKKRAAVKRAATFTPECNSTKSDWVEESVIEDVPFVLEESEHSILEPIEPPSYLQTAVETRSSRVEPKRVKEVVVNGGVVKELVVKKEKGFKKLFRKVF